MKLREQSSWVSGRSRTGERGRDRHHRDFKSGGDDRRRDKNYKYDREGIRDHDRTDRLSFALAFINGSHLLILFLHPS